MDKFYEITRAATGEIRVGAKLFEEEQRHGVVLRGFSREEAREMAIKLLILSQEEDV